MAVKKKAVKKKTSVRRAPAKKAVSRKRKTTRKKTTLSPFSIQKDEPKMTTKRKRRKTSSRKRSRYLGGSVRKASTKKELMANLITGATAVGGAVAGSFIVNKLPLDNKLKAVLPFAGGAFIASRFGKKHKAVEGLALGLMVMGGLSLVKQFAPNVPLMAGDEEANCLEDHSPEIMGVPSDSPELLGLPVMDGEEFISPEDI